MIYAVKSVVARVRELRSSLSVKTREFAKFGVIGGVNFLLDTILWNLLVQFAMPDGQVKAKVIATVVATTSSFFMNRHWTFRHRERSSLHREYILFFFFNGVALAMQTGAVAFAKYSFDISSLLWLNVANLVGIILGTAFRFWSYRKFVWFMPSPEANAPEAAPVAAEAASEGEKGDAAAPHVDVKPASVSTR